MIRIAATLVLPIVGVYDGDTVQTQIPLPPPLNKVSVRVLGVDTPERGWRAECEHEQLLAAMAREHVQALADRRPVMHVDGFKWDKYGGRIDGNVTIDGVDVAQSLIAAGLARPYDGGARASWCE